MANKDDKGSQLVVAAIYDNIQEANIAQGMLRTNGIPCVLNGEIGYSVLRIQLAPSDGIRLMVFERDYYAALQLLEADNDE